MRISRSAATAWLLTVVVGALFSFAVVTHQVAADDVRSAREIILDFDRVRMPSFSGGNSPEALAQFEKAINDGCREQGELALELLRSHPDHTRVPAMMSTRWAGMNNALGESPCREPRSSARELRR